MAYEFRSLRVNELPAWFDHVNRVFNVSKEYFMNHWYQDPQAFLDGILVAVLDGEIVSTVRVFDRQIHIGGAVVTMGGIGEVSTVEAHRRQGLSGQLLRNALKLMAERQMAVSVLFTGKHRHYQPYGWEVVPQTPWRYSGVPYTLAGASGSGVDAGTEVGSESCDVVIRPVNYAQDMETMARLYEQTSTSLAGPIKRTGTYWWNWLRNHMAHVMVAERNGVVVAYLRSNNKDGVVDVTDFAVTPGEVGALVALLNEAMQKAATAAGTGSTVTVTATAALDVALAGRLSQSAATAEVMPNNHAMCQLVDAGVLAQQMLPIWTERLQHVGWQGEVRLDTGVGAFVLLSGASGVCLLPDHPCADTVTFIHAEFINLLYGQGDASSVGKATSDAARAAVQALFPQLVHVYWGADGF